MSQHRVLDDNKNLPKSNPSTISVNRGTTNIFYKTRMCQKFVEGNCQKGDSCTFAHGCKDLREPPPNWQELEKGKRCHQFVKTDEYPYNEKCYFLHENPAKFKTETARTSESSVVKIQTMVDCGQPNGAVKVTTVSSDPDVKIFKTRICSKWETTGECVFGDKCHFAHGLAELHTPVARMGGGGSIAASSHHLPVTELPPRDYATVVPSRQGEGKGFAKLKLSLKNINRIYGDWIDDEEVDQNY